jgi:hypothetical protein
VRSTLCSFLNPSYSRLYALEEQFSLANCNGQHKLQMLTISFQSISKFPCTLYHSWNKLFHMARGSYSKKAVMWLSRLVAGLLPRRPDFTLGAVHVGFVVEKLELGQVFSEFFGCFLSVLFHHGCPYSSSMG